MVLSPDIEFMDSTSPDFIVWSDLKPKQSSVWAYLYLTKSVAVLSSLSSSDFQTLMPVVVLEVILSITPVTCSISMFSIEICIPCILVTSSWLPVGGWSLYSGAWLSTIFLPLFSVQHIFGVFHFFERYRLAVSDSPNILPDLFPFNGNKVYFPLLLFSKSGFS